MQKCITFLSLFLFSCTYLSGQNKSSYELFGSYVDINHQLIHEYTDQDYTPSKSLSISVNSIKEACPGIYYPPGGVTGKGKIQYIPGKAFFTFQKKGEIKNERIDPPAGWAFTVGADSFIVADNFTAYNGLNLKGKVLEDPHVLQCLGKTGKFSFYKFIPKDKIYTNYQSPDNFLVKKADTNELVTLPLDFDSFIKVAAYVFQDYPELNVLLQNKDIPMGQMEKIIGFIHYSDAVKSGRPLYYTANWEITEDKSKGAFYAAVTHPEAKWRLDFFNPKGQKIFTEHYAFKNPAEKEGHAIWYYPESGIVRKELNFDKKQTDQKSMIYYPDGSLHYVLTVTGEGRNIYNQVFAKGEGQLLDARGSGSETFFDESAQRNITREYRKHVLTASWFTSEKGQKIYQYADKNCDIRSLNSLSRNFGTIENYPENDLLAGIDGVVLVKVLVAPDDRVEAFSILKGLSPSIDSRIMMLVPEMNFRAGKHNKENVYQEIVLPVQFILYRQISNRHNFYHHHNSFFWDQMNMQLMQDMQNFSLPSPAMPR